MNIPQRLALLLVLTVAMTSFKQATEAKSLPLDKVVRALDALYRRQQGTTTETPTSSDGSGTISGSGSGEISGDGSGSGGISGDGSGGSSGSGSYSYGSGSSEERGKSCATPKKVVNSVRRVHDYMFIQSVRSSTGAFNGMCMDLYSWLDDHEEEEELADESAGLDSIEGSGSGSSNYVTRRTQKMSEIKRSLRNLKKRMATRGSGDDSYDDDGEIPINDMDILWHQVYLSCYVWLELSYDYYYDYYKK